MSSALSCVAGAGGGGATQEGRKESKAAETRPRSCSVILLRCAVCVVLVGMGQRRGGEQVRSCVQARKERSERVMTVVNRKGERGGKRRGFLVGKGNLSW